jgi:hypothetical protein
LDSRDYGSFDPAKVAFLMRKMLMKCLLEVARSYSDVAIDRLDSFNFITPLLAYMTDNHPGTMEDSPCPSVIRCDDLIYSLINIPLEIRLYTHAVFRELLNRTGTKSRW